MALVEVDATELNQLDGWLKQVAEKYPEAFHAGTVDFMTGVYQDSQVKCPADTGVLRESGVLDVGKHSVLIKYTAPYAAAVHDGYKRHWVAPRRRKFLRWEIGRIARLSSHGSRKNAKFAFSRGHFVPRDRPHTQPNPYLMGPFNSALNGGKLIKSVVHRLHEVKT